MKDVLITGGAGKIGYELVKKLLDTDYSVTVLDLESKHSFKKLGVIKDKIKIVYGDVEDKNLMLDLVKRNDIVIDYAGVMPPLAELNENIANSTNYGGTKNIVDSILEVNPDCVYIYMSFISIYGNTNNVVTRLTVNGETNHPDDYYSVSLIRSEDYIKSKLKKYCILRMPIVLTRKNYYIRHMRLDRNMDFITVEDLNNIVYSVMKNKKALGKTYNISGFKANSSVFLKNMYKLTGKLNLLGRTLYYGEYDDSDDIDNIVNMKYTSANSYFKNLKKNTNPLKRKIWQIINYLKYLIIKNKEK